MTIGGVLLLAAAATGAPGAGTGVACPSTHRGAALVSFALFDGPIADNAILAPESSRTRGGVTVQRWPVAGVYAAGRRLNLRCDYRRGTSLVVPVRRPVRACTARIGRSVAIACR